MLKFFLILTSFTLATGTTTKTDGGSGETGPREPILRVRRRSSAGGLEGLASSDSLEVKLRPEPCQCPVILNVDSDWMPQGYEEFGEEVNEFSLPKNEGWDGVCSIRRCGKVARIANKIWFNKDAPPTLSTLLEVCKDMLGNGTAGASSPKLIEKPMMGLRNAVNKGTTNLDWRLGF
ncbi:hypothetical protein FOL46_002631 [Perkinsus olseni]|uniref:Uncharacterized protein n=1 Tax=Perkinsus olseni TaxID=32597 RepID=A0A7J6M703_PEROL|nr:hypothetical protein FOL46_002631 [Perkinsus olseni]